METLDIIGKDGGKAGKVEIPQNLDRFRPALQLLREVVIGYRRNRRRGTASTLTKGEVSGSGRKPWRQKGTGRARAGYRTSPVWRGGGVVFGPKPRDFARSIPRGMRRKALAAAIADKLTNGEVVVVENVESATGKTKDMARWLDLIGAGKKPLIVVGSVEKKVAMAVRNIPGAAVIARSDLNALDVFQHEKIVVAGKDFEKIREQLK